jgi:hypothetical protein
METYSFEAFKLLKTFFCGIEGFYNIPKDRIAQLIDQIEEPLFTFLIDFDVNKKIEDISKNTGSMQSFIKRFYGVFNAFFIVKYLNSSHEHFYKKVPVNEEVKLFLGQLDMECPKDIADILECFRNIDKTNI